MNILESYNLYPDCVSMQLELIPKSSSCDTKEQFDLYLTIGFNKQWISLLEGRIECCLKGGILELNLKNGELNPDKPLISELFTIIPTISPTNPTWCLSPRSGESLLKGFIQQTKLGTLTLASQNFRLEATFPVSQSDISIANTEDLWKHDISPNKHGVLERAIALFLLKTHFQPYLSWMQLACDDCNDWQPLIKEPESTLSADALSHLKQLIDRIYESATDNFIELTKLAELNPLKDLTGGNFLATNLSGITLNGANLYRSNFRGAVLTDADFSEANLSYAKLSGADLSGAYLEKTNLSYADLHNASLALGNAIAANFTGANLVGANLSNTNFSGAIVSQAKFGENQGLSDEAKQSLIERGALVE